MCYYKTKDIIFTMRFLGYCDIKNTLRYVHLINFDKEEYVCKCAKEVSEASQLIESGFEYVTEMDSKSCSESPNEPCNTFSFMRRLYFLLAFPAQRELQYLLLLSNVVKTFPQIEHFFSMTTIQQTSPL
jgi:hypothetical protein